MSQTDQVLTKSKEETMTRRLLKSTALAVATLPALAGCSTGTTAPHLLVGDSARWQDGPRRGESHWNGTIDVSPSIAIPAYIEITAKGNGSLTFDGFTVKVYDSHDDGVLYNPYLLNIIVFDYNGDGFNDLLIVGEQVSTGEKGELSIGNGSVVVPVFTLFLFDQSSRHFTLLPSGPERVPVIAQR